MKISFKILKFGLLEGYFGKRYIKRVNSLQNKTSLITNERLINESINVEELHQDIGIAK